MARQRNNPFRSCCFWCLVLLGRAGHRRLWDGWLGGGRSHFSLQLDGFFAAADPVARAAYVVEDLATDYGPPWAFSKTMPAIKRARGHVELGSTLIFREVLVEESAGGVVVPDAGQLAVLAAIACAILARRVMFDAHTQHSHRH